MFPSSMLPKVFGYISKIFPATWGYINMRKDNFSELNMIPLALIMIGALVVIVLKIRDLEGD